MSEFASTKGDPSWWGGDTAADAGTSWGDLAEAADSAAAEPAAPATSAATPSATPTAAAPSADDSHVAEALDKLALKPGSTRDAVPTAAAPAAASSTLAAAEGDAVGAAAAAPAAHTEPPPHVDRSTLVSNISKKFLVDIEAADLEVQQRDKSSPLYSAATFEEIGNQPDTLHMYVAMVDEERGSTERPAVSRDVSVEPTAHLFLSRLRLVHGRHPFYKPPAIYHSPPLN